MATDSDRGTTVSETRTGKHFAAFISYSHADEEFGDWLHKRLETYNVPSPLVGRIGPNGPIRKRLGKVFRDRVELSATHDLGAEIRQGLDQSEALIVLCSPRSCGSKYVHEEIRYFKELGNGHRIYAAIVDGEPHAAGRPGRTAEDECFPPALIYRLGDDREISTALEPNEPIAADFRDGKDGRENGALKLIAGLIGVRLDELIQREKQAERRRRLLANLIAASMSVLAVGAIVSGGFALSQRNVAVEQRNVARSRSLVVFESRIQEARDRGDYGLALRYALATWRLSRDPNFLPVPDPNPRDSSVYAAIQEVIADAGSLNTVSFGDVSVPEFDPSGRLGFSIAGSSAHVWEVASTREVATLEGHQDRILSGGFSPDGSRIVTASMDRTVRIWDAETGLPLSVFMGHESFVTSVAFSPDGRWLVSAGDDNTVRLWDVVTGRVLSTLRGHSDRVRSASFAPDSTRILTASDDRTVRMWDTSGRPLEVFRGSAEGYASAVFNQDGTKVLARGVGGETAEIWPLLGGEQRSEISTSAGGTLFADFSDGSVVEVRTAGASRGGSVDFSSTSSRAETERLANTVCTWILPQDGRSFSDIERAADPLIGEVWLYDAANDRSMCP